jgi:transposase
VVRWRCEDRIEAQFEVEVHERTVCKSLNALGDSRLSVRPQHPKSDPEAQEPFKETS